MHGLQQGERICFTAVVPVLCLLAKELVFIDRFLLSCCTASAGLKSASNDGAQITVILDTRSFATWTYRQFERKELSLELRLAASHVEQSVTKPDGQICWCLFISCLVQTFSQKLSTKLHSIASCQL